MALTDKVLPIGFAALGTGYFAWTMLQKPADVRSAADVVAWERHKRDARIALFAGLGAAGLLLLFRGSGEAMDRDSFA
jgi:hypothetical protein